MAAGRRNAFLRGFGGMFGWIDVLNRHLLSDSSPGSDVELALPTPEMMRCYEEILPGSADRLLAMAEHEQIVRVKYRFLGLISSFVAALAIIALSAYAISLGFAWVAVVIVNGWVAAAVLAFIYSNRN